MYFVADGRFWNGLRKNGRDNRPMLAAKTRRENDESNRVLSPISAIATIASEAKRRLMLGVDGRE